MQFPSQRSRIQLKHDEWPVYQPMPSEDSGNDGERDDGAAGFKLQCCQETLGCCIVIALSLQNHPEAIPNLMSC